MKLLRDGSYGVTLRTDDRTEQMVLRLGGLNAPGSCYTRPEQVHYTLYKSPGMHGISLDSEGLRSSLQRMANRIGLGTSFMFNLHNLRVHGSKYLMWYLSGSLCVKECHQEAMELIALFVTPEHKEEMVRRVLKSNPNIRKRDLDLVRRYALEWVRWRNVPHLLCAYEQWGDMVVQPGLTCEHRGVFVALELTAHGPNGHIEETLLRIPIIPHFV